MAVSRSASRPRSEDRNDRLIDFFAPGTYVPIPAFVLTPDYIRDIGSNADALLLTACLLRAYDLGRHRRGLQDGHLALADAHLQEWWGVKSASRIRRARNLVQEAFPRVFEEVRLGCTGRPTEYLIRRTTEADALLELPTCCYGMPPRQRKGRNQIREGERATDRLGAALAYRGRGLSVIPLHGGRRGKQARVRWQEYQRRRATQEEITKWFRQWPGSNVAIVTGAISDLIVVDIDGSPEAAAAHPIMAEVLEIPTTVVATAGGQHHWFRRGGAALVSRAGVLEGEGFRIDIRADGGYVVAPPSIHPGGTRYYFKAEEDELPDLPDSFRQMASVSTRRKTDFDRIRRSSSIVNVIRGCGIETFPGTGSEYVALCPFHPDTNPSLSANDETGLFHCFACGKSGDAVEFVRLYKNCGLSDAVAFVESLGVRRSE